jgi:sulfide:quinone oxidoreductase
VLIAGGGVAGLETLLALHALASDLLDITILAPELKFINLSMSVDQPFQPQRVRGLRLQEAAAELGARWHQGALDRVEPERNRVITTDGHAVSYDMLVLALGAHPEREWHSRDVLTYHGGRDSPNYRLLLHQLIQERVSKLAFVKPVGPSWPLPLYDLALLTATNCAAHGRSGVELSLITPEEEPLGIFGKTASAAIRRLLDESGVTLHTSCYGTPSDSGSLDIMPGERRVSVDRIVTVPRLVGPRVRGIACEHDGFIATDAHGRLPGLDGVFAAGDATSFPVKQGGLAAQQADAVAEMMAASVGVDIEPQPFRPILRGLLLTGGPPRYLQADISGRAGDDSTISGEALWWPPDKLAGRYLAPYLSSQVGDALDVMPQGEDAIPVEAAIDLATVDVRRAFGELPDLPSR